MNRLLQPAAGENGQALMEFAIIFPLLLILLTVPLDFFRVINTQMLLNNAAADCVSAMDHTCIDEGSCSDKISAVLQSGYATVLDAGRIELESIEFEAPRREEYTYYVYSSDKDRNPAYSDKFDKRPSNYSCRNVSLRLSYIIYPITLWGRLFLGEPIKVHSDVFTGAIYTGGYDGT